MDEPELEHELGAGGRDVVERAWDSGVEVGKSSFGAQVLEDLGARAQALGAWTWKVRVSCLKIARAIRIILPFLEKIRPESCLN